MVGIIGRIAGFRPGAPPGTVEKIFGWFGIVILGGMVLGICLCAGLMDWAVSSAMFRNPQFAQQQTPQPKPIRPEWDDKQMQVTYLSDMQEFNVRVGFGTFGKKGKLGYRVAYGDVIQVDGKKYANAISTHPPSRGISQASYRLQGQAKLFKAWCAISDADDNFQRPASPATFRVLGDGVLLWASPAVTGNRQTQACRISVEGVDTMELQIHCHGSHHSVRGVWLEPQVLR
ncbi:MAG TPA: NPCBM/NEW2 domain-containing protein [Gemmataceae bacterium]|nr:NPCBM/NEW2 domain-containing protein [Gemmataceae bacterium]